MATNNNQTAGVQKVFLTPLNISGDGVQREPLGTIRFEGDCIFKYVKFTGTTVTAAGDFVCYVGATDFSLTVVDAANSVQPAGVSVAAHALAAVEFGWVQCAGPVTLSTVVASGVAGQNATSTGATSPALKVAAAVTDAVCGRVYHQVNKQFILDVPY